MRILHGRWRRRVSLLAMGALEPREQEALSRHLEACVLCREDLLALQSLLEGLERRKEVAAPVAIPLEALVARVKMRLQEAPPAPHWRWGWAGAALALGALLIAVLPRLMHRSPSAGAEIASSQEVPVDVETLRRLERNVSREQAVRFLDEAEDVLVTVAAHPRDCDREKQQVDVGDEARRSREILARRTLLREFEDDDVASAKPVLEDVEHVLRQVAALESCARAGDLESVRREVARRQLLMKVRLMSRELQG